MSLKGYQQRGQCSMAAKPVDMDQFSDAIEQLGLFWLVVNEHPSRG